MHNDYILVLGNVMVIRFKIVLSLHNARSLLFDTGILPTAKFPSIFAFF